MLNYKKKNVRNTQFSSNYTSTAPNALARISRSTDSPKWLQQTSLILKSLPLGQLMRAMLDKMQLTRVQEKKIGQNAAGRVKRTSTGF